MKKELQNVVHRDTIKKKLTELKKMLDQASKYYRY